MAVVIFRDDNSGKVIFNGVETKSADVNTLACSIVDTDFIKITDTTSPTNAPLFRKLHYSDVNKRAFSSNSAASAGSNAVEVKAYIDSQISYNVPESVFSTGVLTGLDLNIGNSSGTSFSVSAGTALVRSNVTDAPVELTLSSTFTYPVSNVSSGKDKVFRVMMSGEETIEVEEIIGSLQGDPISTVSLREKALIGIVFYNNFLNKFTFIQTVSNAVKSTSANIGELAIAVGAKVVPSSRVTLSKSNVSDVRLGIGEGEFYALGLNNVEASPDSPNLISVTADPDLPRMQMVDKADGSATYRLFENTTLTNQDGDSLWTKFLDEEGFMDDVDSTEWVVMPVRITKGKVLSPINSIQTQVIVCVGQKVISDTRFKNNVSLEIANALNSYDYADMLYTQSALIGCIAMRGDATNFADSDKVYIITGDESSLLTTGIEEAATAVNELFEFDYVVDPTANAGGNGSLSTPYQTISEAVAGVPANSTVLLKNTAQHVVTGSITLSDGITFIGEQGTVVGYSSWNKNNAVIFQQPSSGNTNQFVFKNFTMVNAAEAIDIASALRVELEDLNTKNIGHSGQNHNYGGAAVTGKFGYDTTPVNLATAFTSGSDFAPVGSYGIDIKNVNAVDITSCEFSQGKNPVRLENCGLGAGSFMARNRFYDLVGEGLTVVNCTNFVAYNNYFADISGDAIVVNGGIDTIIGLNVMSSFWNSAVVATSTANFRFRDNDIAKAARATVQVDGIAWTEDAYVVIDGTSINDNAEFCIDIMGNEFIHEDEANAAGVYISDDKDTIDDKDVCVIKVENNGFKNFLNGFNVEADLDKTTLLRDGNSFVNLGGTIGVYTGANTQYFALPYAIQAINLTGLDVRLDATSSRIIVKEGANSTDIVDIYGANDLQAIDKGTFVRIVLRNSNKIQFCNLDPSTISIGSAPISSVVADVVNALNAVFTNSGNFLSSGQLDNSAPAISAQSTDIEEGAAMNFQIALDSGSNTPSVWNVTGLPSWMTHNGSGLLQGTAPSFANDASDVILITAKVANSYGGDSTTITVNVVEEAEGNIGYYSFDGVNDYAYTNTSTGNNPFYRPSNGIGYAWAFSVTIDDVDNGNNSSIETIISQVSGNNGFSLFRVNNHLRFRWGSITGSNNYLQFNYNNFFAAASSTGGGSGSSHAKYGETKISILMTFDGSATGSGSSNLSSYYDSFRIYVIEEDETITRIDDKGAWSHADFGYTGAISGQTRWGSQSGTSYYSATRLYGCSIITCRQGGSGTGIQELSTDTERIMFALDYNNYLDTYQVGKTFRKVGQTGTQTNWAKDSSNSQAQAARFYEFFTNTTQDVFPYVQNLSATAQTGNAVRVIIVNGSSSQIGND